jgi:hypothetical protein
MNKTLIYALSWLLTISFGFLTFSCSDSFDDEAINGDFADQIIAFEEGDLKESVLSKLKLNPDDIGSFEMKRAHLNADGQEDGYIFINLAPKAKRDMENSSNPARFHDAGYIGDYNYIFVWDGATQKIGTPFKLVGNGLIPLEVALVNLLDPGFKTITAQYRVQNSVFQTYFLNVGGSLIPVFSYLIVDQLGTDDMQVYFHKLEENPGQLEMDIVIYEGLWSDYDKEKAAFAKNDYALGKISSTGKEIYRFFFDPRSGKYATNSPLPTSEN